MNRFLLDRRYWLVPLALWSAIVASSLAWNLFAIQRQVLELSTSQGREVFHMMDAMRLWNARHGGVYAKITEDTPPNPYLDVPDRDVETLNGMRLTLLNPAYMTRQVTATVRELTGVQVHMTSLKPINPGNLADAWETAALQDFERGGKDRAELVQIGGRTVARFMAPLVTRQACLDCHAKQGYRVGDIRGGISVTLDTAPFVEPLRVQKRNSVLVHLVGWLLVAALTLFALARWREQVLALGRAKDEQEALVELRTSELRREVVERRQAEIRLRLLMDASGNGIFGLAANGECTFINPVAQRLLGLKQADTMLGRPILDLITPDAAPNQQLHEALRLGQSLHSDDCVFARADGTPFHVEVRLDPIDGDGTAGAVVNFADITQRKATEASIWHQANYDALTGLANRRLLSHRLDQMITDARRSREIIALLFVDLDGFKAVNDAYGHDAGDNVLRETALRLQAGTRESDLVARLAGDEFLVVLRYLANREHAGMVAGKLVDLLGKPVPFAGHDLQVSASVGISIYPDDAENAGELVKAADLAMYRAKEAGKHTYRYYAGGRYTECWLPAT
ncbi:diguanylate cyclase [Dechloromonas sp. XY25]|uniref:Diguanylate cyclase n=1 Tax=Dechloromonas hankyongensis TaxID=2908002 RepID=A0ABS9K705_9RHOO|nr:diguanylate cyclase [Dechloromonas hankyongensis]MCG2578953.1 diguanylate cyclase [Dechloromonas hankyongensis]